MHFISASLPLLFCLAASAGVQLGNMVVAYSSLAATFSPGWTAKREGLFASHNLDVEMVLMQGPSTYLPALASGNIQVMYGRGIAISRVIGTGGFDSIVVATETRYVSMRLMVVPTIRSAADLLGCVHRPARCRSIDARPEIDPSAVSVPAKAAHGGARALRLPHF